MSDDTAEEASTIQMLQLHMFRMQNKLDTYRVQYNAHLGLQSFLELLLSHYQKESINMQRVNMTSDFVHNDSNIQESTLFKNKDSLNFIIENLWLGRIENFSFELNDGEMLRLKLHPENLECGRPQVVLERADGTVESIQYCLSRHLFFIRYHPQFSGIMIDSSYVKKWMLQSMAGAFDSVSIWPNCEELRMLAALWLGILPANIKESTMVVDGSQFKRFLGACVSQRNVQCHFVCFGEKTLTCSMCLLSEDKSEIFRYFIGTVVCF